VLTAKWVRSIYATGGQVAKMPKNAGFVPVFTPKCLPKWPIFLAGAAGHWTQSNEVQ